VAFWTMVELHAGWQAPLYHAYETGVPRSPRDDGQPLIAPDGNGPGWSPPRPLELVAWARPRWVWDRRNARGPMYGFLGAPGDRERHNIVIPNSDVNVEMLTPWILARSWKGPTWRDRQRAR